MSSLKMKKVTLLSVVLSTWVTFITAADLYWDLRTVNQDKYTGLLKEVREELQGSTCFQIPMIGPVPDPPKYVVVKLIVNTTQNIFVALNGSNSYVVGYSDTFNGKARAFLLEDAPKNAKEKAFPDAYKAKQVETLNYGGSYKQIEKNAGDRRNLVYTRKELKERGALIFGKEDTKSTSFKKEQAKFILMAVEMVAEATRFEYMAIQFKKNLNSDKFSLDPKMYNIVTYWGDISNRVAEANPDGTFKKDLTLIDPNGKEYKVREVDKVRKDMGLLKYVEKKCAVALSLQMIIKSDWAPILYAGLNA